MHKIELIMSPHPFFDGMTEHHLKLLAEGASRTHFHKGTFIFREGELANRFYLIQQGSVSLESPVNEDSRVALQTLSSGDVLGWSWLFAPYHWHFDARALEDTEALVMFGTRLRELCESDKTLGYEIMKRVAEVVIKRLQTTRLKLAGDGENLEIDQRSTPSPHSSNAATGA